MLTKRILKSTTAAVTPEQFACYQFPNRRLMIILLVFFLLSGFALRSWNLGSESLSEDELNKLRTVSGYKDDGLSGRNGEHPFLMKGFQLISLSFAEKWNAVVSDENRISDEFALRMPTAVFGTFTALLLFILVKDLFGSWIGLLTAGLWSVDPTAIGFDRIAKEDGFLLFFFVLANVFWIRSQTLAETGRQNWTTYTWLTAVALGAMVASKYLPYLLVVSVAYYYSFQGIPGVKWQVGKFRWIVFFSIMGIAFVVLNPTILLPETWREMLKFTTEKRIGHDSYEFMGRLYRNQMTLWLNGVPWTFYYVLLLVKTPLLTLFSFAAGLFIVFRRRLGDGRIFIFFWAFLWFFPFSVLGGKFTRYFTIAEPLILIIAAVGFITLALRFSKLMFPQNETARLAASISFCLVILTASAYSSLTANPHYRLYVNHLGGGSDSAGFYFPHDEFYDTSTRETVAKIAGLTRTAETIANETPYLYEYYAGKLGRNDLKFVSLSDPQRVSELKAGNFVLAARGRNYFSNRGYLDYLTKNTAPVSSVAAGKTTSVLIFRLDEKSAARIIELAKEKAVSR